MNEITSIDQALQVVTQAGWVLNYVPESMKTPEVVMVAVAKADGKVDCYP